MYGFKPRLARKLEHSAAAARQHLANGGPIRGPGTGTSDSIDTEVAEGSYIMPADSTGVLGEDELAEIGAPVPVRVSNGEYEMPPEQVHAVGVRALDAIRDATHTPTAGPRGFARAEAEPQVFFADGGVIDEGARRRAHSFGDAAATSSNPDVSQVRALAPVAALNVSSSIPAPLPMLSASMPPSPQAIQLGANEASSASKPAAGSVAASSPAASNPLAQTQGAAFGVYRREPTAGSRGGMMQPYVATGPSSFEPAKVQEGNGRLNAFNDPRSTLYQGGSSTGEPPTARGFTGVGEGWGMGAQQAAARQASTQLATAPVVPTASTSDLTVPPVAAPVAEKQETMAAPAAREILPGVFKQGNSYSDSSAGTMAGIAPRSGTGAPAVAFAPAASPTLGFQPGGLTVIGNPGPAAAQAMFDDAALRTAVARGSWSPRRGFQSDQGAVAAAAIPGQNRQQAELEAGRQAAELERASLGFQSAAQREAAAVRPQSERIAAEDRRAAESNAIRRDEVAGSNRVRDIQVAAAQDEAALRRTVLDPKTSSADRVKAQQALLAVQGKVAPSEWGVQVTPTTKNADGSSTEGSIYRFNRQTGEVMRVDGQGPRAGLPPGMDRQVGTSGGKPVYEDAQGRRFVGG
jgi:hypothetical protein